jgi:hypothetical protein
MKTFFKGFLALFLGLSLLTSCSKDDNYAKEIEGTYTGNVWIASPANVVAENAKIVVAAEGDTKVKISINETISILDPDSGMQLSMTIKASCDANVTKGGETYTASGSTTATLEMEGMPIPVPATITGTFNGNKMELAMNASFMEVDMSVNFSGTR